MEIKFFLKKPYNENEKMNFIVEYSHNKGFEIRETDNELQAWGYDKEEKAQRERERKDQMTLTPADVERALYHEKHIDFSDLKEIIKTQLPAIDSKALNIEFNASNFFRGAMLDDKRLFDVVGLILGYKPEQVVFVMDYLFENKKLPTQEQLDAEFPPETDPEVEQDPEQ